MLQHVWTLKTLCQVKAVAIGHILCDSIYTEMSRQTAPGRESRLAVAKRLEGHVREMMAAVNCASFQENER